MVMAFNTEAVARVPQHWHDLLAPELKGKLSFYDAPYQSLYAFAQMKAGKEGRPGQGYEELKKDLDAVLRFAVEQRDIVRVWWTSTGDFMAKLLQKEVAGGIVHNTGPVGAEAEGKPVRTIGPRKGRRSSRCSVDSEGHRGEAPGRGVHQRILRHRLPGQVGHRRRDRRAEFKAAEQAGREDKLYAKFLPTSQAASDSIRYYPYDIYFDGNNWARINDVWDGKSCRKKG